jgi:hypothetical protein
MFPKYDDNDDDNSKNRTKNNNKTTTTTTTTTKQQNLIYKDQSSRSIIMVLKSTRIRGTVNAARVERRKMYIKFNSQSITG